MLSDVPFILKKITQIDPEIINVAFGPKGLGLLSWVKDIDLSHPSLSEIKSLADNSELLCQYLDFFIYAQNNSMSCLLDFIKDKCDRSLTKILQDIGSPYITHRNFRFVNKYKLNELRKIKSKNKISSAFFHEKAARIWHSCPSDFSLFEKNNTDFYKQKIKNQEVSDRFLQIGCTELASTIKKNTEDSDDYFGFKRIKVIQAAFILAKMHNFVFCKTDQNNHSIVANTSEGSFLYCPTVCPIVSFTKHIPDSVLEAINKTDNEPTLSFKPIFDNHLILIPSLGKQVKIKNRTSFLHFDRFYDDENLVENQMVKPVVLGEKDKECYFICGWH